MLTISSTAVSMALAMELAMFTFAIVALAVGALETWIEYIKWNSGRRAKLTIVTALAEITLNH